jgi:PAS domain S-box-containing protein
VKFIFIFFLKASYDPQFIFELTPLYLLSGFSNVQLLSLSLLIIVLDMMWHLQSSKRNLLLSFIPTALILTSLGFNMMFNPIDLTYIFHYILFGCLLLIVLIDYQYVLKGINAPRLFRKTEPATLHAQEPKPTLAPRVPTFFTKKAQPIPPPPNLYAQENVADLKRTSDTMVQKMQYLLHDLEKKAERIETLENKIQQQHTPVLSERIEPVPGRVSVGEKTKTSEDKENLITTVSSEEKIILKERIENHLVIDEMDHIVAVIQRGIFRDISNSFAEFLGYDRTELLQKNFFVFIAPRGFDDARKYYLNRLKGITTNSFKTVLLTKTQTEVSVEITVAPTVYKGDSAEFISIKGITNQSSTEN